MYMLQNKFFVLIHVFSFVVSTQLWLYFCFMIKEHYLDQYCADLDMNSCKLQ